MICLLPIVAILLPFLPNLISAQCAACDSYTAALQSCQTTSANVTAVGTTMDSTTLHCMCTSKSGVTEMNACLACEESNPSPSLDSTVLLAWTNTCKADGQYGDQQAATCWASQPSNDLPCFSNIGGSGGAVGGTNGGGDVAPASASAGVTSGATTSPTAAAKSDAMLSLQAPVVLSFLVMGVGLLIVL